MRLVHYFSGAFLVFVTVLLFAALKDNGKQILPHSLMAGFPEPPAWHEVARKVLLDGSWEMKAPTGWWIPNQGTESGRLRAHLEGCFAASDQTVRLIVLDKANWEKLQMGYPPLSSGTAAPGMDFSLPISTSGYYLGFFRQASGSTASSLETGSLALALLREFQIHNPPPVRMTAKISLVIDSYCTFDELKHQQDALNGVGQ